METERFTHILNAQQLEQALAILRREQQAYTASTRQERIFKFFNIAIYALGIVGSIFLLILIIGEIFYILTEGYDSEVFLKLAFVVFLWGGILLAGIPVAILSAGILILFFSNLAYIRQLLRQNKLIHRLGLKEALRAPWIKKRQKRKAREVLSRCIRIVGFVFMLCIGGTLISLYIFNEGYKANAETLLYLVIIFIPFACSAAIIANHIVQRTKVRLKLISQLSSLIKKDLSVARQEEGDGVQISAEAYEKIAQIERAQISRGRMQSILDDLEEPDITPYVIQKSRAAKDAQGRFDGATSLRVQEQIEALMTEPHPPGIAEDAKTGRRKLHIPHTPVIIEYTVGDDSRRVRILSLETTAAASGSPSEQGGAGHV